MSQDQNMPDTCVLNPAIDAVGDVRTSWATVLELVNIAYLTQANVSGNSPVNLRPSRQSVIAATNYIASAAGKANVSMTNIQPIFVAEGIFPSFEVFGFAATVRPLSGQDPAYNALIYRGTVTDSEAAAALEGWSASGSVSLPTNGPNPYPRGTVNTTLSNYYQQSDPNQYVSMAQLTQEAVRAVAAASTLPWVVSAHSLGQALIELAAADCALVGLIQPRTVSMLTFGGLVLGYQDFATFFTGLFPNGLTRVVNICDFVPTIQGLTPYTPGTTPPYVQIGGQVTFAWHRRELWENHSLTGVYKPMLTNTAYFKLLNFGNVIYPISTLRTLEADGVNGDVSLWLQH